MLAHQASLLDIAAPLALGLLDAGLERTELTAGAWIDVRRGWIEGSGALFEFLRDELPWRAEQREMYDAVVDVPRLLANYGAGAPLPHPILTQARDALSAHYAPELGEPFVSAGCCLYRDGRDSVAWHGDRIGRSRHTDTLVAIVSLGADRDLSLRPRGGGSSRRITMASGDLLIMGGSCQRTWDHAVLKTTRATGPRISVQFRPHGVA